MGSIIVSYFSFLLVYVLAMMMINVQPIILVIIINANEFFQFNIHIFIYNSSKIIALAYLLATISIPELITQNRTSQIVFQVILSYYTYSGNEVVNV